MDPHQEIQNKVIEWSPNGAACFIPNDEIEPKVTSHAVKATLLERLHEQNQDLLSRYSDTTPTDPQELFSALLIDGLDLDEPKDKTNPEEPREPDLQPALSDINDVGTQFSRKRPDQEVIAERTFAELLANNKELKTLVELALTKTSKGRLGNNLRRLLLKFYRGLSHVAKTNLEKVSADIIRSRWRRTRITAMILKKIAPGSHNEDDESEQLTEWVDRRPFLEDWLARLPGGSACEDVPQDQAHLKKNPADENSEDEEKVSSEKGDDASQIFLPRLAEAEKFLMNGESFSQFLASFRALLLPASLSTLTRVIFSLPRDRVWFSDMDDRSYLNRFKITMETLTEEDWNWWPLRPKMRMLIEGQTRVHWICHCGTHFWSEITNFQAETYKLLLRQKPEIAPHGHICINRHRKASNLWPSNWIHQSSGAQSISDFQFRTISPDSSGQTISRGSSHSHIDSIKSAQSSVSSYPIDPTLENRGSSTINIHSTTHTELFVLIGIDSSRKTVKLAQLDVTKHSEDQAFFNDLRREFRKLQGSWRYWFSPYQLQSCDFAEFKLTQRNRILLGKKNDIPDDPLYEYSPRPAVEIPPIDSRDFQNALLPACEGSCLWGLFHDCGAPLIGKWALERIPKRKAPLDVEVNGRRYAWGLQVIYKPCALIIFLYHIIPFVVAFTFWVWWQTKHPDDIQSAAVPMTTVLAIFAVIWSGIGFLKKLE